MKGHCQKGHARPGRSGRNGPLTGRNGGKLPEEDAGWDERTLSEGTCKAWKIREEWATDREKWKGICNTRYPAHGDGGER